MIGFVHKDDGYSREVLQDSGPRFVSKASYTPTLYTAGTRLTLNDCCGLSVLRAHGTHD